jgi:hypothetical protein
MKDRAAAALGRRGGRARARRLTLEARRGIASLGGKARRQSLLLARRIDVNLRYAAAMRELRGEPVKVRRLRTFTGRLPGIYPDKA